MKLKDFDFRLYNADRNEYVPDNYKCQTLAILKTESNFLEGLGIKIGEIELELFTGIRDKDGEKIYEGDIVAHYAEGGIIEYHSKVVFNQEKGAFEFVCIEYQVIEACDDLANPDIGVVGNTHYYKSR